MDDTAKRRRREEEPKLLSIGEAAAQLGISVKTLRAWADKGYVKAVRFPTGYRRFTQEEIARKRREMGLEG